MRIIDLFLVLILILIVIVDGAQNETDECQSLRCDSSSHVELLLGVVASDEVMKAQADDRGGSEYAWPIEERERERRDLIWISIWISIPIKCPRQCQTCPAL